MNWPTVNWTNSAIGAIGTVLGIFLTWLSQLVNNLVRYWLEQRKEAAAEDRAIRKEEREQQRKRAEEEAQRQHAEREKLRAGQAQLLLYKTQINGCDELFMASQFVAQVHVFFQAQPEYLRIATNVAFLQKYPAHLHDLVCQSKHSFTLHELKLDLELLQVV